MTFKCTCIVLIFSVEAFSLPISAIFAMLPTIAKPSKVLKNNKRGWIRSRLLSYYTISLVRFNKI